MLHKKRWLLLVVITLFIVGMMTGCGGKEFATPPQGGDDQAVDVIKIGSIHPLTGSLAHDGTLLRDAMKMALDEVNEAGGIKSLGGAKLELVNGDSEGSPEKAVSELKRLIKEGCVVNAGCYTSSDTYAVTQEAEKQNTPFVITVASASNILDRGFKYTFRIQPHADGMAQDAVEYIDAIRTPEIKTMSIIHEDSLFGTSFTNYIKEHENETGLKIASIVPYPTTTPTLDSEISKLAAAKPDIVVGTGYYRDQTLMLKTLREQKFNPRAVVGIANGAFSDPNFIEELGDDAELILDINYHINPKSEFGRQVKQKFRETYGVDLSASALYGYTAGQVIADAIERAGSTDTDKIREALTETNFENHVLPGGPIMFDETGENINAKCVLIQIQNGKHVVVYPEEYAEADLIFPTN